MQLENVCKENIRGMSGGPTSLSCFHDFYIHMTSPLHDMTSQDCALCDECLQNIPGLRNLSLKPLASISLSHILKQALHIQLCFFQIMRSITGYRALVRVTTRTTTDACMRACHNSLELPGKLYCPLQQKIFIEDCLKS